MKRRLKSRLRLALPALVDMHAQAMIPFALLDHSGQVLRGGALPLTQFATANLPVDTVEVVLHPGDAIVATVVVPPVRNAQLTAAVSGCLEPMVLSDLETLCIAHSPRATNGHTTVAWVDRQALQRVWQLLAAAGLHVRAIVPHALALPAHDPNPDQALALPADARWQTPLPLWSLARAELRPNATQQPWRNACAWGVAAVLCWVIGLQLYAAQLRNQVRTAQQSMTQAVQETFPHIPVIIDPVHQARTQRDALRLAHGTSAEDDFMPLAMASAATLGFAANAVTHLTFRAGELVLTLGEGVTPPDDIAALQQRAATQGLILETDAPQRWRMRRASANDLRRQP